MAPLERFFSARSSLDDKIKFGPNDDVIEAADLWVDSQPSSQNKKVHFCGTVAIVRIQSKKTMPSSIKSTLWYHKKDYARFRESCREFHQQPSVRKYDSSSSNDYDEEEYCSRGLEKFSRNGTLQYTERHTRMMNDFYLVRITGGSEDEIARLLIAHSNVCKQEALERARKDERDALLYHMKSVRSNNDALLISNLLPKARNLLDREAHITSEERKRSNNITAASCAMASTSHRARQMRMQRLSAAR
jgi:hypothetical protein